MLPGTTSTCTFAGRFPTSDAGTHERHRVSVVRQEARTTCISVFGEFLITVSPMVVHTSALSSSSGSSSASPFFSFDQRSGLPDVLSEPPHHL
eukprot:3502375-Amphidinium_carterae.1